MLSRQMACRLRGWPLVGQKHSDRTNEIPTQGLKEGLEWGSR